MNRRSNGQFFHHKDSLIAQIAKGQRTTKPCTGPIHQGKELPLDQFHLRNRKNPYFYRSWCKECLLVDLTNGGRAKRHGFVPYERVQFAFVELRERLGTNESARRMGITKKSFSQAVNGHNRFVQKETAVQALRVLKKVRETDEYHVRYGGKRTNRPVKEPDTQKRQPHSVAERDLAIMTGNHGF